MYMYIDANWKYKFTSLCILLYCIHIYIYNFTQINQMKILNFQSLKKVGNIFIVNLAIADICVTAFVDPFSIVGKYRAWIVSA